MNHPFNGNKPIQNESLTSIRGIGSAKKLWLESLGIQTIADLVQLSPEGLKLQLKQAGYTLSASEVESWLDQAQALITPSPAPDETDPHLTPPDLQIEATALSPDWDLMTAFNLESQGCFAVELQTRQVNGKTEQRTLVQHLETGKQETIAGVDQDKLQRWILHQLQANLQIKAAKAEPSDRMEPIPVAITQLQFFQAGLSGQPMIASKAMPLFPDALLTERPFSLEVSIQIPEVSRVELADQPIILHAACEARHLASGQVILLGETRLSEIVGSSSGFTLFLPNMILAEIGNYRLRVTATLENWPAIPALFKVPILELESATPPVCLI